MATETKAICAPRKDSHDRLNVPNVQGQIYVQFFQSLCLFYAHWYSDCMYVCVPCVHSQGWRRPEEGV